jgi:hypothetical protein
MRFRIIALAIVAAVVLACHNPNSGTPVPTPTPTPVTVASIKLNGPTRFAPTSSPTFTVAARMSDGTSQDYTSKVQWNAYGIYGPTPIVMSSSGGVTVRSSGEATIQARFGNLTSSLNAMVIPDGTYRLVGTVNEAGLPVTSATVSVVTGTGSGLAATTDYQGQYRLYGVAGPVQVQVSKLGYDAVTNTATISTDDVLDFPNMSETGGPPTIAGTYSLSIVAAGDCHVINTPPLATPYRNRTYTAVVTESGPVVTVTLSGANFVIANGRGNKFAGRVTPGHVSFTLGDTGSYAYYYYYTVGSPDVVEQLDANSFLSFWGTVDAPLSPAVIAGSFYGNIVTYTGTKLTESCASNHHQFTMTPMTSTRRKR